MEMLRPSSKIGFSNLAHVIGSISVVVEELLLMLLHLPIVVRNICYLLTWGRER